MGRNSATLIYGTRDAVLVDTFFTIDNSIKLADEIAASGKNPTYTYITHGHGDHFFGINALKQRFPDVRAVATASDVDCITTSSSRTSWKGSGADASLDKCPTSRAPLRAWMEHRSSWRTPPDCRSPIATWTYGWRSQARPYFGCWPPERAHGRGLHAAAAHRLTIVKRSVCGFDFCPAALDAVIRSA